MGLLLSSLAEKERLIQESSQLLVESQNLYEVERARGHSNPMKEYEEEEEEGEGDKEGGEEDGGDGTNQVYKSKIGPPTNRSHFMCLSLLIGKYLRMKRQRDELERDLRVMVAREEEEEVEGKSREGEDRSLIDNLKLDQLIKVPSIPPYSIPIPIHRSTESCSNNTSFWVRERERCCVCVCDCVWACVWYDHLLDCV